MKTHVFRLKYGDDLKDSIIQYCQQNGVASGVIITAVGCVYQATLRLADGVTVKTWEGRYEIVSLTGTISKDGVHLHIALSDEEGKTIGGHLMSGTLINTTCETVIGDVGDEYEFSREYDGDTGYDELVVNMVKSK